MKVIIFVGLAGLMLATIGCTSSTDSHRGAQMVMKDTLMTQIEYNWSAERIIYTARLKNEGDLPAYDLQFWITCYDSSGSFIKWANWSSASTDTVYPGLSIIATVDLGWSSEGGPESHGWGIDSVETDIEWRD